ncbi:hypothetical protein SDC9_75941 [bioreactor metagenome]|uniref:Uncharacterized protein n=1 Tax=bioreactor metagenome TaxID=1076179 RepID=A0A644YNF0_9ZZZZ
MQRSTFIELDIQEATISVAVAIGERGGEVPIGEQCRTAPIMPVGWWRSWRRAAVSCVSAMKLGRTATGCTGNSSRWGSRAAGPRRSRRPRRAR